MSPKGGGGGGKACLVGGVEEGEVAALADDVEDAAPLLPRGVDARGVVSAGVKDHDRACGGGLEVLEHPLQRPKPRQTGCREGRKKGGRGGGGG